MAKVVKVWEQGDEYHIQFMCPACNIRHTLNNTWEFNGDYEKPSFSPSILEEGYKPDKKYPYGILFRCHSWVTKGKIKFFADCSHDKAGQKWFELLEIN